MKYRKLSPSGDYTFGHSLLDFYINTPEAVAQSVQTRILLWLGEWYQNIEEGTPFMQGIIGKHGIATANATLQERITSTDGVISLDDFESSIDPITRKFTVSGNLNTIYGVTPLQVSNYANY